MLLEYMTVEGDTVYQYYPTQDGIPRMLYSEGCKYISEVDADLICLGRYNDYMKRDPDTPLSNALSIPAYYQGMQLVKSADGSRWRRSHKDYIIGFTFLQFDDFIVYTHQITCCCVAHVLAVEKLTCSDFPFDESSLSVASLYSMMKAVTAAQHEALQHYLQQYNNFLYIKQNKCITV